LQDALIGLSRAPSPAWRAAALWNALFTLKLACERNAKVETAEKEASGSVMVGHEKHDE
jgi:hypothetical protein